MGPLGFRRILYGPFGSLVRVFESMKPLNTIFVNFKTQTDIYFFMFDCDLDPWNFILSSEH